MKHDPLKFLALAKESPARVKEHDKAGWLRLFSRDAYINDPVGTPEHRRQPGQKTDPLERFYETFIAPTAIVFESSLDVVAENEVVRDVVIHTQYGGGPALDVEAYLHYKIVEEDGELRLSAMEAHWDGSAMSKKAMAAGGIGGMLSLSSLSARMLRFQGIGGVAKYTAGLYSGIGARGCEVAEEFSQAAKKRNAQDLIGLFVSPESKVELRIGKHEAAADLLSHWAELAEFRVERPLSSGWVTAFRFAVKPVSGGGIKEKPGIGFFYFDKATRRIAHARFFIKD